MATDAYLNEEQFHSACFIWFWNTYPEHRQMLFHVQQKSSNRIEGARHKAMGKVKGVSDFIFITTGKVHFIELKWKGGKQSDEQKAFQLKVQARQHKYFIVETFVQFKLLILQLLGNGRDNLDPSLKIK